MFVEFKEGGAGSAPPSKYAPGRLNLFVYLQFFSWNKTTTCKLHNGKFYQEAPCSTPHCVMLPPSEFNDMIPVPFPTCSGS